MTDVKFIFVVGPPGSKWSRLTDLMRMYMRNIDTTDLSDERKFYVIPLNRDTHFGCWFGPDNEYGQKFDNIKDNYTVESFTEECLRPFSDNNSNIKIIRSHWFAYNLDWLQENFKGHQILLINNSPSICKAHWDFIGGWTIHHPVYTWYKNDEYMLEKITEEYNNLNNYGIDKKIVWYDAWWAEKKFPISQIIVDKDQKEKTFMELFYKTQSNDPGSWRCSLTTIT
jgi:hypothetical protein